MVIFIILEVVVELDCRGCLRLGGGESKGEKEADKEEGKKTQHSKLFRCCQTAED